MELDFDSSCAQSSSHHHQAAVALTIARSPAPAPRGDVIGIDMTTAGPAHAAQLLQTPVHRIIPGAAGARPASPPSVKDKWQRFKSQAAWERSRAVRKLMLQEQYGPHEEQEEEAGREPRPAAPRMLCFGAQLCTSPDNADSIMHVELPPPRGSGLMAFPPPPPNRALAVDTMCGGEHHHAAAAAACSRRAAIRRLPFSAAPLPSAQCASSSTACRDMMMEQMAVPIMNNRS